MNFISIFTDMSSEQSSETQKKCYKDMMCENSTFHEEGTCQLINFLVKYVIKEEWNAKVIAY